jgi:hypothetical protein
MQIWAVPLGIAGPLLERALGEAANPLAHQALRPGW